MAEPVALAVLNELGVLFSARGEPASCAPPPYAPDADHCLRLRTPLWAHDLPQSALSWGPEESRSLFEPLTADPGVEGVLARTRLVIFLGALDSPTFRRCLEVPDLPLVIIEPCRERLEAFARRLGPARLARRALLLQGEPDAFAPPLSLMLADEVFLRGIPAFYVLPELQEARPECVEQYVRIMETLFYRTCVYPLSGQAISRGLPLRSMTRVLFYDQQQHAYENSVDFALCPDIQPLRKAFLGETAVLVAAGPDLPRRMDYLRSVQGRAVLIAVNNALKPLLAQGVRPHFVVANDTSTLVAQSWAGLEPMADIALVGHCLVDLGGELFARKYLFGNYLPEVFGNRPNLRLHASVITTAFSLARHMGCARCILAGVELSSQNPWSLSYARGSIHGDRDGAPPPEAANPHLYSLQNRFGQTCYTTPNFLDAALWLLDEIRHTGLPCVNLTQGGIVHGPGVEYIPDCPVAETGRLPKRLSRLAQQRHMPPPLEPILEALGAELACWTQVTASLEDILALAGGPFLRAADQALRQFDASNISYLVQRFEDFDNRAFHREVFESGSEERAAAGLRYYLEHVRRMAAGFAAVLRQRRGVLAAGGVGTENASE